MSSGRHVFFDIGNVLLFFSHERMCRQLGEGLGMSAEAVRERIFSGELVQSYDRGTLSTAEFMAHLRAGARRQPSDAALRRAAYDIFDLNRELLPLLDRLEDAGHRLALLSNTCEVHSSYFLQHFPELERFSPRILSHRVGALKPEAEIFEIALREAGCEPQQALFIDDLEANVAGARAVGIESLLYESPAQLEAALRPLI